MGTGAGTGATPAAYDAHADWYNEFMSAAAGEYIERVHSTLQDLLGPGEGRCLDVCCGTGAQAGAIAGVGWTPVGVDLSGGQLRHALPRLPTARTVSTPGTRPPSGPGWAAGTVRSPTC